jgi:pyridoxal phosphate-dependent aminotransferase EpsN
MNERIYLSPPDLGDQELAHVLDAFRSNWIAPLGPHVDAFEEELAAAVQAPHAVALSSGTAALHLALEVLGIGAGDEVWISTLTFAASAFPVRYVGATPVFVDADRASWNMDPALLSESLDEAARRNALPRAVILVHLYGQCADVAPIAAACRRHGVLLIEDAAEALGATYDGQAAGTFGDVGFYSFNGNKIITTSGGGMLVTPHAQLAHRARSLATQAREPVAHYEHRHIGYNYRLSNVLAGIGRGQLQQLEHKVAARRAVFDRYRCALQDLPGVAFMPEATFGRSGMRATRWLTTLTIDAHAFGADRSMVCDALTGAQIEARPVWKPMHQQPVFAGARSVGGTVADALFANGLCLPSGSSLTHAQQDRVIAVVQACAGRAERVASSARADTAA